MSARKQQNGAMVSSIGKTLRLATVLACLGPALSAQAQFEDLVKQNLPKVADHSSSLAHGDVDGDGDPDILVGNNGQNRLYLGDGKGRFSDVTATHLPRDSQMTSGMALADVDGDGDPDLLCGNGNLITGEQNRLYLNDGKGRFTDVTASKLPQVKDPTLAVALGDVDGDKDPDLVVANGWWPKGHSNALYLNDGKGGFSKTVLMLPRDSFNTRAITLVDLDRDGDLDLLLGNSLVRAGPQPNALYLNDGKGRFVDASATHMPRDQEYTYAVVSGDVDADGDPDLLWGNRSRVALYLNDGKGRLGDASKGRIPATRDWTWGLDLGDVDGDGDLDLVLANYPLATSGQNRLFLNDGKGLFRDATATAMPRDHGRTYAIALLDADRDGDLDQLLANDGSAFGEQNRLYRNDGRGRFHDPDATGLPAVIDYTSVVLPVDVDGDGDDDLVIANYGRRNGEQNRLYLNERGRFRDVTATRLPRRDDPTFAVAAGDLDADGDADLVFGNGGSQNRLYLGDGKGGFTDATSRLPADKDATAALVLGDVDGDGDLDLVCGNSPFSLGSGQDRLYLNNGKGVFADATSGNMPRLDNWTRSLALGDIDRDGDLDLICGNGGPSILFVKRNSIYLNDGKGRFTDATSSLLPPGKSFTSSVVLADVDRDGDLDLASGNRLSQNRLFLNGGKGKFRDVTSTQLPPDKNATSALGLADLDGDQDLDLMVGNSFEQNRIYLNDGNGKFADVTGTRLGKELDRTTSLALLDVDLDGDMDLVSGNHGQNRLELNLLRQVFAPLEPSPGVTQGIDLYAMRGFAPAGQFAIPYLGLEAAQKPIQTPFGAFGLKLPGMIVGTPLSFPATLGETSMTLAVPRAPSLLGKTLRVQALVLHGLAPSTWRLTNVSADAFIR